MGDSDPVSEGSPQCFDAAMTFIKYSLLSRGRDTVRAANRGNARSQAELGHIHVMSATKMEILEGASADDDTVVARWAETMRYLERPAEQGDAQAQLLCGMIYAFGGRGVPQNWTTVVKWWRKAAEA